MRTYYRVHPGKQSAHAELCRKENFVGVDNDIPEDLTGKLTDSWRTFNKTYIPVYLTKHPEKSKIAAGLACGMTWVLAKGMEIGDIVLVPDGSGRYYVGEINGNYYYSDGNNLPHRRPVNWLPNIIERSTLSVAFANSIWATGTVITISRPEFINELNELLSENHSPKIIAVDSTIEKPSVFALEEHLEDFLIKNWSNTDLGKFFDIYQEDGESVGQQYETDTGPLDILAISKDKKQLLVVELKKGRASDAVVGQTLRYMGYVKDELAEEGQSVIGAIIALEDDQRIRRALSMIPSIQFYRYEINFRLVKN